MAVINGGREGVDVSESARRQAYAHAAKYYKKIGKEPPPLKSSYLDHAEHVLASVQAFIERSGSLADLRSKEGRVLSAANRERLSTLHDLLAECAKDIKELLDSTQPAPEKGEVLFAEYQAILARLQGVPIPVGGKT